MCGRACAWHDAAGQTHPTWPIRAYREILRRVYTLFQEKRPHPLLMVHMSSEVVIPMLSFTDTLLDGEQFGGDKVQEDYLEVLPPDKFRAEFMGRNWGPVAFFLPELREPHVERGTPDLAAYLLLHDVQAWPIWSDVATWNRLYEVLDAHDVAHARFRPYWARQWRTQQRAAGIGFVVRGRSASVLLAVMNTGEAVDAQLTLDMLDLHGGRVESPEDMLSGAPWRSPTANCPFPSAIKDASSC